jgi:1,4-alpha-glucan branching enzyme
VTEDALDFVARAKRRVEDGGVCVCALDTELLGHWWYEGIAWLEAVIEEAARRHLAMTTLDEALERTESEPAPTDLRATSWGEGGDLRTWSGPAIADLAWQSRTAELHTLALGTRPPDRALRELLALQSSDWAFLTTRELAGEYPRQRARGHAGALEAALAGDSDPKLRNLAPEVTGWMH